MVEPKTGGGDPETRKALAEGNGAMAAQKERMMQENLSERVRQRQADLSDELQRQSRPVAVLTGLLRNLERPWPDTYELKTFKDSVFGWLAELYRNFSEARSSRDSWASTVNALEREAAMLKVKLSGGELENPNHERDLAKYHIRKVEVECYQEALVRLETDLTATEREWERTKPTVEGEIERYADLLFEQERYSLQGEVEEMLSRYATVRVHAAELSRWHSTLQERFGLTIAPRRVIFDPELPAAHNFAVSIERVSHA